MEDEIKTYSVVMLNSGGPTMTVTAVSEDGDSVECLWFGYDQEIYSKDFPIEALTTVD